MKKNKKIRGNNMTKNKKIRGNNMTKIFLCRLLRHVFDVRQVNKFLETIKFSGIFTKEQFFLVFCQQFRFEREIV